MKKINLIFITLILVVILLGIEVVIVKSAVKYEPLVDVVYAKTKIASQKEIKPEMLYQKKVNISMAHSQSFRNIKDLTGKKSKVEIEEGEMILSGKLGKANEMEQIEVKDKNNRLFTVEFKGDQANGWWIKVGQYVDIIFIPNEKPLASNFIKEQDDPVQQATTIPNANKQSADFLTNNPGDVSRFRNIRVAALIDEKGNQLKNSNRETLPRYISFEVTDSQDEVLAYAKSNGRLEVSVIPEK